MWNEHCCANLSLLNSWSEKAVLQLLRRHVTTYLLRYPLFRKKVVYSSNVKSIQQRIRQKADYASGDLQYLIRGAWNEWDKNNWWCKANNQDWANLQLNSNFLTQFRTKFYFGYSCRFSGLCANKGPLYVNLGNYTVNDVKYIQLLNFSIILRKYENCISL